MFGHQPDNSEKPAAMELVRLAFSRRLDTQSRVDYLAEVLLYINSIRGLIRGVRIVEGPEVLRQFTLPCEPVRGRQFLGAGLFLILLWDRLTKLFHLSSPHIIVPTVGS